MNLKEITGNSPSSASDQWFSSDARFHQLYPDSIQLLSGNHWTALSVARKAANFLAVENGARILDIGSGIGKFCLAAAYYRPGALFFGVEQRKDLVEYSETARTRLGLNNVTFIHENFTGVDFGDYDHFYFYNAFYENVASEEKIDDKVPYSAELYNYYNYYLYKQLEKMPAGTRVATFYGTEEIMPPGYHIGGSEVDDLLKYWVRE